MLRHVRGGTASVATFLESDIEVDEIEIEVGSDADGAVVAELHLPHSIVLGAVIRPGEPGRIVRGYTVLNAGDNVVVFARPDSLAALAQGVHRVTDVPPTPGSDRAGVCITPTSAR